MNVTCTACPAKYSVADEKVRGKKVRITCKHCGTAIIVDGTTPSAPVEVATAIESTWLVGFSDERQEPHTTTSVVELYTSRAIDDETFLWKEGMADWLTPFDIPEVADALGKAGQRRPAPRAGAEPPPAPPVVSGSSPQASPVTSNIASSSLLTQPVAPAASGSSPQAAPAAASAIPRSAQAAPVTFGTSPRAAQAAPAAANPFAKAQIAPVTAAAAPAPQATPTTSATAAVVSQASPAAPVTASVPQAAQAASAAPVTSGKAPHAPQAPSDRESTSPPSNSRRAVKDWKRSSWKRSAPASEPSPEPVPQSRPGAARVRSLPGAASRDLFGSVDSAGGEDDASLIVPESDASELAPRLTGARNESSVLFSLEALTQSEKKPSRPRAQAPKGDYQTAAFLVPEVDQHPMLNTGGGVAGSMVAPDFTRPISTPPPDRAAVRAVDGTAPSSGKKSGGIWIGLVVALAGGAGVALWMGIPQKLLQQRGRDVAPVAHVDSTPSPPADTASAAAPPIASTEPSPATASASAQPSAAPSASSSAPRAVQSAVARPAGTPVAASKPAEAKAGENKPAEPKPEPAAAAGGAAFNRDAAVQALGAAANAAASCRQAIGPTGAGRASVTFAPSGRATMANITGAFAGTEVGSCVARLFRSAKIPPFSGDPVTVSKSFSIQ